MSDVLYYYTPPLSCKRYATNRKNAELSARPKYYLSASKSLARHFAALSARHGYWQTCCKNL